MLGKKKIIKIHRGKEHNCRHLMELTTKVFTLDSRTTFCLWITDSNRPQVVLIGSHTSSTVLVSTGELQGYAQPTQVHTVHQCQQHKTMGKTLQQSLQMTPPLKSPNKQPPRVVYNKTTAEINQEIKRAESLRCSGIWYRSPTNTAPDNQTATFSGKTPL